MVNTEILPISKLRVNSGQIARLPKNPRLIRDERFEKLKQSIKNLPSMLDIRELVCVPFTRKWGRWQHQVDYRLFKTNKLKKKADVDLVGINNYGMRLILHNDSR